MDMKPQNPVGGRQLYTLEAEFLSGQGELR